MNKTAFLLPAGFVLLFAGGALMSGEASARGRERVVQSRTPAHPGTFPDHWINGVDCFTEPEVQIHKYNDDFFIFRQSKCSDFEAPFMYLIFGRERALLIDTGSFGNPPIGEAVYGVIDDWLEQRGQSSIQLVVTHSHIHGDHVANDNQFAGQPDTVVVGIPFFKFPDWPRSTTKFDLGGRLLTLIPTRGHQNSHISFYDPHTQILITGDTIYPGHLFTFSPNGWNLFRESIDRLRRFALEHPVTWVLGCHIEMTSRPGGCLPWGTTEHPDEHVLQLHPGVIDEVYDATIEMGDSPRCKVFDDFVIHPVNLCGIVGC